MLPKRPAVVTVGLLALAVWLRLLFGEALGWSVEQLLRRPAG